MKNNNTESQTTQEQSIKSSSNEDLAKRLLILRSAVHQRITSTVSLIKATAKYVQDLNNINDQDIAGLQTIDKQIAILNGDKKI